MTQGVAFENPINTNLIKGLGVLNQDYVVYEQLGVDGRIHRNFVTLEN